MKVKKVLLIEDGIQLQSLIITFIKIVFGDETEVVVAGDLKTADYFYQKHGTSVDLILMDTSLDNGETTHDLVEKISREFNRPIVAISTNPYSRKEMISLGCTHESEKADLLNFLRKWKDEHVQ